MNRTERRRLARRTRIRKPPARGIYDGRCAHELDGERCPNPATRIIAYACIHEHGHTPALCDEHAEKVRTVLNNPARYCNPCFEHDGHSCDVITVSDTPYPAEP